MYDVVGKTQDGRRIVSYWDTNIPYGAYRVQVEVAPGHNSYSSQSRLFNTEEDMRQYVAELEGK